MGKYSKFYTSVIGGALTFWSTYANSSYTHWLPAVLLVCTALGVVIVPNVDAPTPPAG